MDIATELAVCPECGLRVDRHTELIPVERPILEFRDGGTTIEGLISEGHYDFPEREQPLCPNGHTFPIPADLDLDYV